MHRPGHVADIGKLDWLEKHNQQDRRLWGLQPEDPWEISGYVHNVVFSCGAVAEVDGSVKIYWGGADSVMCVGIAVIEELVGHCLSNSHPAF